MQPNENDNDLFAGVVLDITHSIIKPELEGEFSNLAEYKELSKSNAFRTGTIPKVWLCTNYHGRSADEEEARQSNSEYESESENESET